MEFGINPGPMVQVIGRDIMSLLESELRWAKYYFGILPSIRAKSKDKHTQVSCIIVGPDNEVRSMGYNSFPRGLNDEVPERYERPEKYDWIEHSERNAIYNAARIGVSLKGCTIYMGGIPCIECARAIIQSGIKRIIYDVEHFKKWSSPRYSAHDKSLQMLKECGVEVIPVE